MGSIQIRAEVGGPDTRTPGATESPGLRASESRCPELVCGSLDVHHSSPRDRGTSGLGCPVGSLHCPSDSHHTQNGGLTFSLRHPASRFSGVKCRRVGQARFGALAHHGWRVSPEWWAYVTATPGGLVDEPSPGVATPGFLGIADYCSGFAFFCANNHSYNFRSAYDGFQLSWPTPGYSV